MPTGGGGGGGGGLSAVVTDSSLTGNGTSGSPLGLLLVSTNGTLTGAGISSSKLGDTPVTFYTPFVNGNASSGFGNSANEVYLNGIYLPCIETGHLAVNVTTADASNNYDLGIYNAAGTLVLNIGAQSLPSTGYQTFAWVQGSTLLVQGLYWIAMTGNATTAKLGYINNGAYVYATTDHGGATSGGALASSVTPPSLSITGNANLYNFVLY